MNSFIKTSVVLFGILEESSSNYRKHSTKSLGVLLIRGKEGYFLPEYECVEAMDLDVQSLKAIENSAGLSDVYVEQLYTFSKVEGDTLFINPCFLGLVSKNVIKEKLNNDCYWCNLKIEEKNDGYKCIIANKIDNFSFEISKKLKYHTTDRYKFGEINNGLLKENVGIILMSAFERLRNKVNYTDIVFNMMGNKFTLKELQNVYETIENKPLLDAAFRRIIADKVEETDEFLTGVGCRPSKIYRYKEKKNENRE